MGLFDIITGGGGSPKVPDIDIPDFDSAGAIRTAARVNRVNQVTPFGSVRFKGPDRNTLKFKLSRRMQRLLNQQSRFGTKAVRTGRRLLGGIPGSGDAATAAILERLAPEFEQQDAALRERYEQGGRPAAFGSAALDPGAFTDMTRLDRAFNDARIAAVLAGPQYQGQLASTALALGSGSPISVPQFNFQGATPIDTLSAELAPYNARVQAALGQQGYGTQAAIAGAGNAASGRSDVLGGLFDIGSAAVGGGWSPFGIFD